MLKKTIFLPKKTSILNNEEGVVIIAALMVLVIGQRGRPWKPLRLWIA
jgi:hypothetical protein